LSPVAMAGALHFDLSVHNFGVQEYMRHTDDTDRVFPHAYRFERGSMHPGDAPGLGVDIDEALAAQYPYEAAYLPTNRLQDGTVRSGWQGDRCSDSSPARPSHRWRARPAPLRRCATATRRSHGATTT